MIENRYGDCKLACYDCGTGKNLMQVAHRDCANFVVGYLFLCKDCLPKIEGEYYVSLRERGTGKLKEVV